MLLRTSISKQRECPCRAICKQGPRAPNGSQVVDQNPTSGVSEGKKCGMCAGYSGSNARFQPPGRALSYLRLCSQGNLSKLNETHIEMRMSAKQPETVKKGVGRVSPLPGDLEGTPSSSGVPAVSPFGGFEVGTWEGKNLLTFPIGSVRFPTLCN